MTSSEARVATSRPSRYLTQFCRHAAAMDGGHHRTHDQPTPASRDVQVHAEWSDTRGVVDFLPWGRATLDAGPGVLRIRIDAADDESLHNIEDVIARDLARFGRREGIELSWRPL